MVPSLQGPVEEPPSQARTPSMRLEPALMLAGGGLGFREIGK